MKHSALSVEKITSMPTNKRWIIARRVMFAETPSEADIAALKSVAHEDEVQLPVRDMAERIYRQEEKKRAQARIDNRLGSIRGLFNR